MSKVNSALAANSLENGNYIDNLGKAASLFIAALFAVKPATAKPVVQKAASKKKEADLMDLYRLAKGKDSLSPTLANELRLIAKRQ